MTSKKNVNVLIEREYSDAIDYLLDGQYKGVRTKTQLIRVLIESALKEFNTFKYELLFCRSNEKPSKDTKVFSFIYPSSLKGG